MEVVELLVNELVECEIVRLFVVRVELKLPVEVDVCSVLTIDEEEPVEDVEVTVVWTLDEVEEAADVVDWLLVVVFAGVLTQSTV